MRTFTNTVTLLLLMLAGLVSRSAAQEHAGHLMFNPNLLHAQKPVMPAKKTTGTAAEPLSMPFFEDFTGYSTFPDSSRWTDFCVYVNNTMGNKPISRGVATFDALDWKGIPYDSFNNANFRYSDSLTSQPINLSLNVVSPADSVYLSFYYQPQGNGFYPLVQDSLMLFLKTKFGGYKKVWSAQGTTLTSFKQVMIPITDSLFYDSFFQFRFINIGALYWADAVWNVDYVRMDKNRNMNDTSVNDIGFTSNPTFLLNDYTSMPYRQFYGYSSAERASQYLCSLRNNYGINQTINYAYTGTVLNSGTILKTATYTNGSVAAKQTNQLSFPSYTSLITLTSVGNYQKVVFRNKHFIQSVSAADPAENDTVIKDQVFDNYLAYDDGSAEKSYYLDLYPTLPGRLAIEYHLNKPDTMQGMAIYFGRQLPFAFNKQFDIKVYATLAGVNGAVADNVIYTQEMCSPGYADTVNHFWVYKFDQPVALPAGSFFAGTFQPAESGSDSLYFGLDVNRIGSNHAYYNVFSGWVPSLISGAIMIRPILGLAVPATGVSELNTTNNSFSISPNPAGDLVRFDIGTEEKLQYSICDMQGRKVIEGVATNGSNTDISSLAPGLYLVHIADGLKTYGTQKLIKL